MLAHTHTRTNTQMAFYKAIKIENIFNVHFFFFFFIVHLDSSYVCLYAANYSVFNDSLNKSFRGCFLYDNL